MLDVGDHAGWSRRASARAGAAPYRVHPTPIRCSRAATWAVVYLDRGRLRLLSRNANDLTAKVPELAALAQAARRHRLIVDAELVATSSRSWLCKVDARRLTGSHQQVHRAFH